MWKAAALCLVLTGCAAAQPRWVRPDGSAGNIEIDKTICDGEVAKAPLGGADKTAIFKGCMAQRGWMAP